MARRKIRILRIAGWIIAGFFALVLVVTLGFYLSRGWIMDRAVSWFNNNYPGEVQMEQIHLIPLVDFPDVVLQLRNVGFYEHEQSPDSLYQEPICFLNEINVSLDVVDLAKGDLEVSQLRLENGFFRMEIYTDSLTNLEHALDIRFGEETGQDTTTGVSTKRIALDRIELTDILVLMEDHARNNHANVRISQLESRFRSLPGIVEAGLELEIDINSIKYQEYRLENRSDVLFSSEISFNQANRNLVLQPSSLKISGLELETWGNYSDVHDPVIDLAFRATNSGLDVLNYLLLGILDVDEIEQIGAGNMYMNGSINGSLDGGIPVLRVYGSARDIGFRIKAIDKDVTDISFTMYATSGGMKDLSEGEVNVMDFAASFPEGHLKGEFHVRNLVAPEIDISVDGGVDLVGIEKMLKIEPVMDLKGHISLEGEVHGKLDPNSGKFFNDAALVIAKMEDVGFILKRDSLYLDTITGLSGGLFLEDSTISAREMEVMYNGNHLKLESKVEDIIPYLLGFERGVNAELSLYSDVIYPGSITRDTALTGLLGEELRGLKFKAGIGVTRQELDAFLEHDSIPGMDILLDSFALELPVYADISELGARLSVSEDSVSLHYLKGRIGESGFSFSGEIVNYRALLRQDSGASLDLEYSLASELMRAEDFFTYKGKFLLPETYKTEYLESFNLAGTVSLPVEGILYDSVPLDFGLQVDDMGWSFRYYPLAFEDFRIQLSKKGNELIVDRFSGGIGESDILLTALVGNYQDSLRDNLYGNLELASEVLDFNELLNYQIPDELKEKTETDTNGVREPPRLDQIDFPDFSFNVDIGELRYGNYRIFGMDGQLRSTEEKIIHLDHLATSTESGGTIGFNGQLNLAVPGNYYFSADFDLDEVNVNDLDFEMPSGEETYTLKENFAGLVSATGLAEVYLTPDLKLDISATTAMFNVTVDDGALINFTPLKAAGKYLDNKDLDHVRFSTLSNSFTLMDSRILIPLMWVESSAGLMLIEGEQRLDNTYLYLLRLPVQLVREAAVSVLSESGDDQQEDEIQKMQSGTFMVLTLWNNGEESGVNTGDKREKYSQ